MRAITTIFATLLIVAVCTGCAARRTSGISTRLFGTWEMTSILRNDRVEYITDAHPLTFLKIYNDTHFVTIHHHANGNIALINGGTYTLNGDTYVETLVFASQNNPPVANTWVMYDIEFRGNNEFQMDGILVNGFRVLETWRRVEADNPTTRNPLIGTWEVLTVHNTYPGISWSMEDSPTTQWKIINETHFAYINFPSSGELLLITDRSPFIADGGTYTFEGDRLIRNFTFSAPHPLTHTIASEVTVSFRGNNYFQTVNPWRRNNLDGETIFGETTVTYRRVGTRR